MRWKVVSWDEMGRYEVGWAEEGVGWTEEGVGWTVEGVGWDGVG